MIAYNTLLSLFGLIGAPALVPLILTTPKWRAIVRQRLAWWTYPWEKRTSGENLRTAWIHALSVGEVTAAQPLVAALRTTGGFNRIVVSCTTLSGFSTAGRLLKACDLCYFPFDSIGAVRRMTSKIRPRMAIIVETDLWPNFLWELRRRKVPVFLANVRLSDRTFRAYRRFRPAVRALYGGLSKIAVQSERDRQRFLQLGIPAGRLGLTGNIKFDALDQALDRTALAQWRERLRFTPRDRVVVAGSTHMGEERMLMEALRRSVRSGGEAPRRTQACRLLIAPRDPGRAAEVVRLARHEGFSAQPLSAFPQDTAPPEVIVIDRLGVLKTIYGLADIAFVGGSLVMSGGHNPLEPAAWGKAVLFGPDMRDFASIAQWLLESGGARRIADPPALAQAFTELLADTQARQTMGRRALSVSQAHRGAVQRTLSFFEVR